MSNTAGQASRAPKRERGKQRVVELLDAAVQVFAEKGYAAATMTEIAARAGAAIGSLYQFFPSKESVADALLARYGEHMRAALDQILRRAAGMTPAEIAGALVNMQLDRSVERAAAIALVDARIDAAKTRNAIRAAMLEQITQILVSSDTQRTAAKASTMAVLILGVLKTVPYLLEEGGVNGALIDEAKSVLRCYLAGG